MRGITRRRQGGFTLVELLVVMAIIAILMGIIVSAAYDVLKAAKDLRIQTEIMQMDAALQLYKKDYGGYPPNLANQEEVRRHLSSAFPRMRGNPQGIPQEGDAATALVFWLSGFSPNPRNPFADDGKKKPLFDFDKTRLRKENGKWRYYPPNSEKPYVYFHFNSYQRIEYDGLRPYRQQYIEGQGGQSSSSSQTQFVNADSFQIISAGQDNDYGNGGEFPSGVGYAEGDNDNIVNFFGTRIENAKP